MENISIVLVSPQGDANIGAVARAMKNFGLSDLRLVNPVPYKTDEACGWAVDAREILETAAVFSSLEEALRDQSGTFAFTRRVGRTRRRDMSMGEAVSTITDFSKRGNVALIFGQEDAGLSNDDISRCDQILTIPTSGELPSLNLSQAVMIACYEIYSANVASCHRSRDSEDWHYVSREQIAILIEKLDRTLVELNYADSKDNPVKSKIINQFNKLFGRAGLTDRDIRMFEGLLSRIKKASNS